ncbi:exonuclease domain-containing protein, partial [Amycolatopsis sp. NPDC054798]
MPRPSFEATCWEKQPPPGQVSEIVGIGLTVVDLRVGERLAKHRILVRPARSAVSPFCTELTGLTQAEVDGGLTFRDACRALAVQHRTAELPWAAHQREGRVHRGLRPASPPRFRKAMSVRGPLRESDSLR